MLMSYIRHSIRDMWINMIGPYPHGAYHHTGNVGAEKLLNK